MLRRIGDEMSVQPKHGGLGALIATKLVCCGGLLLFATGVLTVNGIGTWLYGGGAIWLLLGALAVALFVLRRRLYSRVRGRPREAGLPSGHRVGLSSSTMEN